MKVYKVFINNLFLNLMSIECYQITSIVKKEYLSYLNKK